MKFIGSTSYSNKNLVVSYWWLHKNYSHACNKQPKSSLDGETASSNSSNNGMKFQY